MTAKASTPQFDTSAVPAILFDSLFKTFGSHIAVDHIDLRVPAGSFFGLVGPNGAGKTTSLAMAVGLLRPDSGTASVFGHDVWHQPIAAKSLIGVLADGLALPERLTGRELLTYSGLLRGLDRTAAAARAHELLEVLQLTESQDQLVIAYSTGMRKKIGLATALMHAPRLLVLDEPFESVDPISSATIKTILQRFVASGGSVIFSSHVMALVEQLCDQVAVMSRERLIAAGRLDEVRLPARTLEETFLEIVGGEVRGREGLEWLVS